MGTNESHVSHGIRYEPFLIEIVQNLPTACWESRSRHNKGKVLCLQFQTIEFLQSIALLIGGMTESNEQSNLLANLVHPVAPGEYLLNKAKIADAKARISAYEEMNEAGKQSYDELARELEQKIREGEQARYVSTLAFQCNTVYVNTPYSELLLQLRSQ